MAASPQQLAAAAVRNALASGRLPLVRTQQCADCDGQAQNYHHYAGYERAHRLSVVPLCVPCHRKRHVHDRRGKRPLGDVVCFSVRLPDDLHLELRALAKEAGRSLHHLLLEAIAIYLQERPAERERELLEDERYRREEDY